MNDRGVSEVIAFILVFSIVITSVGLLYTAGFGSLTQIQESETDRSAERAFSAAATALEDIQRGRGEHRSVDLELSGRTMVLDDSPSISVAVDGETVGSGNGTLVYGIGSETEVAYQSGAVIQSDGPNSQYLQRPGLYRCVPDEHAVVTLVSLSGPNGSVSTDNSIEILADGPQVQETTLVNVTDRPRTTVTIDYGDTPYTSAWNRSFTERSGWNTTTAGPDQATCTADRIYVRDVPIELEYQGV